MQPAAPKISTCPTCGGPFEKTGDGELRCMVCLLRAGIGSEERAHESTHEALQGDGHFGVYEIDRHEDGSLYELGHGGMGVTYRATDTTLQRKVALKIIKIDVAERSADARERFIREARAAAALRHQNIATIHQFGIREETGQYFYAMELIEGETLDERVHRAGPLDAWTTIDIAQQVTSALAAAEKQGLVHRDLKPANLMLFSPEGEKAHVSNNNTKLLVKIIDFGLAKALHAPVGPMLLTQGDFVGTPAFASPEQFEHSALDVRSDIYSLGATLWFALTGKIPFAGHKVEEIHRAQQSNALPMEQLKAAHVPHRLRSLLESMLSVDPAARPGTHELAARLQLCSPEARTTRRMHAALVTVAIVILGASALFVFHQPRIQNAPLNPAPDKSIAVLPFENRSEDKANAYFADGIRDEILTRLSKIADLKVISRTSTQRYKSAPENLPEIARQLGVAHVLEGSVQKSGNTVRVNVQLIKTVNDSHLWADTFDRKVTDIFSVESEVAKAIADQLRARLTVREQQAIADKPTNNPAAYDAYLRGLGPSLGAPSRSLSGSSAAAKAFGEAVKLDPDFALGWAELARTNAYMYVSENDTSPARRDQSAHALEMARRLRSDADEILLAQAYYEYWVVRDYDSAKAKFTQLRQRLPSNADVPMALALIARRQGLWDESLTQFEEASQLNPLDLFLLNEWARTATAMRQFSVALKLFDRALSISPNNPTVIGRKAIVYQITGDLESAGKLLTGLVDDSASDLVAAQERQLLWQRRYADLVKLLQDRLVKADPSLGIYNTWTRVDVGEAQQHAGDVAGAEGNFLQALTELKSFEESRPDSFLPPYLLSHVFAGLGRNQEAVQQAERAVTLLPSSRDAVTGPCLEANLAKVLAHVGENDRAIAALERLLKVPALWEPPLTPAVLRLDPIFDPLRNDPRFQKLCEETPP
jgi:serine/threonine protein kinase/Flp pilus assembly protein TadD